MNMCCESVINMYTDISVFLELDRPPLQYSSLQVASAESLCLLVCKELNITPLTSILFGLRVKGCSFFLKDDANIKEEERKKYEFRLRFKVQDLSKLKNFDENAFEYYFWQIRNDLLKKQVHEIRYPEHKNALFGLGLTDMYRAMLQGEPFTVLVRNYKHYIHKDIRKKHSIFAKLKMKGVLKQWKNNLNNTEHTPDFLQTQFVEQVTKLAPNYLVEEFSVHCDGELKRLEVNPYHKKHPGLLFQHNVEEQIVHICSMAEICFIGRCHSDGDEHKAVIHRRHDPPLVVKFKSELELASFISCCNGYYRLMVKWIFNLSKNDLTPSLEDLLDWRWHGPIGCAFSYWKLENVAKNAFGCYIVRQCESYYDTYYIDVCTSDKKFETCKMVVRNGKYYLHFEHENSLKSTVIEFDTFKDLVSEYSSPGGRLYLKERVSPKENDKSQLLLCAEMPRLLGKQMSHEQLHRSMKESKSPHTINSDDIAVVTSHPCIPWNDIEISKYSKKTSEKDSNYCRNVKKDASYGPWCYALSKNDVAEELCHVRRCDAMDCKLAGTAHDYAGTMAVTRSGRNCSHWSKVHKDLMPKSLHKDDLYAEGSVSKASNYCRNPSRTMAGKGGGLFFSLKEWNPDFLDGIMFQIFSMDKQKSFTLRIGAEANEKVILTYTDHHKAKETKLYEKTLLHLIPAGKWGNFWLQMPKGKVILGMPKRENPVFEWETKEEHSKFEPVFMSYQSLEGNVIGVHFPNMQCHTENTSTLEHTRMYSIRLWKPEDYTSYGNFSVFIRGTGVALIPLLFFPDFPKETFMDMTETYCAWWTIRVEGGENRFQVSFKILKKDREIKNFLDLADIMASVDSDHVVKLYGLTLSRPTALVMEYLPFGRLDQFLKRSRNKIDSEKLMKCVVNLARGLWDLSEVECVHGRIRCSEILITSTDPKDFQIKIADPGLHSPYDENDIHWIPVEYLNDMEKASKSPIADVWAFATTAWQIFNYGAEPHFIENDNKIRVLTKEDYEKGMRLQRPENCDSDVWQIIRSCWSKDAYARPKTQPLVRDLSYVLNQTYIQGPPKKQAPLTTALDDEDSLSYESRSTVQMGPPSHEDEAENQMLAEPKLLKVKELLDLKEIGNVLIQKKLGIGHFGEVKQGILSYDDGGTQNVAVKELRNNVDVVSSDNEIIAEIEMLKSVTHNNIVRILGYCAEPRVMIVMEYLENGALDTYISRNRPRMRARNLHNYAIQVAQAMFTLASNNIVHRDLAARNILVVDDWNVKLADFGLARFTNLRHMVHVNWSAEFLPLGWYAPEVVCSQVFTHKSDVWSFGVTLWEMFTYCQVPVPPFDTKNPAERAHVFFQPVGCPQGTYPLMQDCWKYEQDERPNFKTISDRIYTFIDRNNS